MFSVLAGLPTKTEIYRKLPSGYGICLGNSFRFASTPASGLFINRFFE